VSIRIDKAKVLSLMLHAADISHPAKGWKLHYRWTQALMEEFFRQVHTPYLYPITQAELPEIHTYYRHTHYLGELLEKAYKHTPTL